MKVPSLIGRVPAPRRAVVLVAGLFVGVGGWTLAATPQAAAVALPDGVRAVWSMAAAEREATPTRERWWLNGLWRWQPATGPGDAVPEGGWGYFKVPGPWPGITDYMQKDSQTVHVHEDWRAVRLADVTAAWYEREFEVPVQGAGRRILLTLDTVHSLAVVFVDGRRVAEVRFPGGEADLTEFCRPGQRQRLSLWVAALPLQAVLQSYTDSAAAREVRGAVARRGLCGDVSLARVPAGPRLLDTRLETSVRRGELTVEAFLAGLVPATRYLVRTRILESGGDVREFTSPVFTSGDLLEGGRFVFTKAWRPGPLWDLHTPGNQCEIQASLEEAGGAVCDVHWKERFGFREFRIEGRDFHLNGSRVFLSAVPFDNAQVSAAAASYAAARESLERLRSFGINFVYTHNYGCEPGAHLGFGEILRAADDVGMLVAFSQPHFSHYDWKGPAADRDNGYARHADFYVRTAGNHPSVVMYAMSHNATGYNEDMNPDMIDGLRDARDGWAQRNVVLARRAEAIVQRLDPGRVIYHHASGNLGPMHPVNFYPNFVPIQEMSDWFEHWATVGVKPAFLCEYGAPFTWDWTMYRGWYQGKREFGSARVPWEFCLAEWNAQFLGDRAFPASELEKANLRWEARQFREGRVWHRWDYPTPVGSTRFEERYPVFAAYLTDNWRAFRTWGVSAISPWEHEHFWRLREGVDRRRRELPVDWEGLQRRGFSADFVGPQYERMDLAYERADWIATPAAEALMRNNGPLLACVAGRPGAFTSKDHQFLPGEAVEKQVILLNNSRETVGFEVEWTLGLPDPVTGRERGTLGTGEQVRLPLRLQLPASLPPGRYELRAETRFHPGGVQHDALALEVLAPPSGLALAGEVVVFDPAGETTAWLRTLGVAFRAVGPDAELPARGILVVGRRALTLDGAAPDLTRVRDGLRVLVLEQAADVLERRLGFRVAEYGLRQVFPRVPDHPVLAGLDSENLRDWRGEATLQSPRLKYELSPRFNGAPAVTWCGIPVPRLWRCGNRGSVASVLLEKPARGDFLPLVDGGYSLQYSPLLEYREGAGVVLFCQMDVTGRTDSDPAAETLARNLLRYLDAWTPRAPRSAVYAGDPAGARHLESIGVQPRALVPENLEAGQVLVVGPGARQALEARGDAIRRWSEAGGRLLALGLDGGDLAALPVVRVEASPQEHISTGLAPAGHGSVFAGIGAADLHNRDPRSVPLITGGARALGNGVLAEAGAMAFCQVVPWDFAGAEAMNQRRTFRRFAFVVTRTLANLGVAGATPLLDRFARPVDGQAGEARWEEGLYLDRPVEWDDPYRFFRW